MIRYASRKFIQAFLLIGVVLLINFFILRLTPGNPYDTAQYSILSNNKGKPLSTAQQAALGVLRDRLSIYFDPWPQAFGEWAGGVLHFDFGHSVTTGQTFTPNLMRAAVNSFWLLLFATLFGLTFGVGLGLYAAYHPHGWQDNTIKFFTLIFIALPGWYMIRAFDWFNTQLWQLTGEHFSIMPLGNVDRATSQLWQSVIQPIFFLGAILLALFWGQVRTQALVILKQDYVRTARAKGLRGSRVLFWHVLRNSLTPIISIFGGLLPFVFAAQILIERFTRWNGLGQVFLDAANDRDYTVLMGVFTLLILVCVVCSFLADIGYAMIDPKPREKYRGGMALVRTASIQPKTPAGLEKLKGSWTWQLRFGVIGAALVIVVVALAAFFLVTSPSGNPSRAAQVTVQTTATTPTVDFDEFYLPADAKMIDTDISVTERQSLQQFRLTNGVESYPEPAQDTARKSKRTIYKTKGYTLDLLKKYREDLEAQGWQASTTFRNIANTIKADYVFEKGNKYFWFSSFGGEEFGRFLENNRWLFDKLWQQVDASDTIVVITQGFGPAGSAGQAAQAVTPTPVSVSFPPLSLPSDAKKVDEDISTVERKSILPCRSGGGIGVLSFPQPEQDVTKESKRTIYITKTNVLDIIRGLRPDLEAKGWELSKTYRAMSNASLVDFVFEKENRYLWISISDFGGGFIGGLVFTGQFNLIEKLQGVTNDTDTVIAIVQGYKSPGS